MPDIIVYEGVPDELELPSPLPPPPPPQDTISTKQSDEEIKLFVNFILCLYLNHISYAKFFQSINIRLSITLCPMKR